MIPRRSWVTAFAAGCLTGALCVWFFRSNGNRAEVELPKAAEAFAEPFVLPGEEPGTQPVEKDHWLENLLKLSGDWVSGDGEQKAKLDGRVLSFGDTPDWPDLQNRDFISVRSVSSCRKPATTG